MYVTCMNKYPFYLQAKKHTFQPYTQPMSLVLDSGTYNANHNCDRIWENRP